MNTPCKHDIQSAKELVGALEAARRREHWDGPVWRYMSVIPALHEQWKKVAKLDASLYHLARPYLKAAHMCHQVAKIKELLTQNSRCFPFDRVLQRVRSVFPFFLNFKIGR